MAKKLLFRGGRKEGKMFRGDPLSDLKKEGKGEFPQKVGSRSTGNLIRTVPG